MLETLSRIYQGYATPKQMLLICFVYYAAMAVLGHFKTGGLFEISNLSIISLVIEWSLGLILMYGAWRSFKNYEEDSLRMPMIIFAFFGSLISLAFGVLGGSSESASSEIDPAQLKALLGEKSHLIDDETLKRLQDPDLDVLDLLKSFQ